MTRTFKRPHPILFLAAFVLVGLGLDALAMSLGGMGLWSFALVLGVGLSGLLYSRRVQYATIVVFAVLIVPSILRLHLPSVSSILFFGVGLAIQVVVVEIISWQVQASTRNRALRETAEARLHHLMNFSPMSTYALRLEGGKQPTLIWVTPNIAHLTGYSAEDIQGTPSLWHSRIHPEDRHLLRDAQQINQPDHPVRTEYRFAHRDGREVWLENTSQAIPDSSGQVVEVIGTINDITARKTAQLQVEEERRLIHELVSAVPSEIWVVELATRKALFVNRSEPSWPHTQDDQHVLQADTFLQNLHPDDRGSFEESLASLPMLQDGDTLTTLLRLQNRQGGWRDILVRHRAFKRDGQGQLTHVLSLHEDITAIRTAERERAATQKVLSQIAQTLPHMIYVRDATRPDTPPIYANRSIFDHLGYTEDDFKPLGRGPFFHQLVHPDDRAQVSAAIAAQGTLTDDQSIDLTYRLKDAQGAWRWTRARTMALERDAAGRATKFLGILEDITASRELEETVRRERDFAELVLGSLSQGVAVITPQGVCEYANSAACRIMGVEVASALPARMRSLIPGPEEHLAARDQALQALMSGQLHEVEGSFLRSDGQPGHVQVTVTPRLHEGELEGVIAVITDVSARKAAQRSLETLNHDLDQALRRATTLALEAQAATQAKSDFLASMSHEIRTPMNAIIGMAEILQGTALDHEQRDSVQIINDSGEALLTLINDILDFSKIEAGHVELDPHPFNLTTVVESAVDLLALRAKEKGLRLASFVDPAIPHTLVGDANRLRQILVNLLSNAVKFTAHGRVTVRVVPEETGEKTLRVRVTVQDTGIGIAPEAIARLFRPFEQAERSTTRRYGGTGLGLAIVKRLATLMGGDVQIESEPHRGTTLILSLPFAIATDDLQASKRPAEHQGRVLICEPDPVVRDILSRYVEAAGFSSLGCGDPSAIWAHLRQGPAFDVVILGVTSDQAATRLLRQRLAEDADLKNLARIDVLDMGQKAMGADATLVRPIKRASLEEALHHARAARTAVTPCQDVAQVPVVEPPAAQTKRPHIRVLLAEDNAINQKVAVIQLEKLGCEVEIAGDGQAALEAYQACPTQYALILMDCQMPVLDGFTATRAIRVWEEGSGRHIPVVAMTANAVAGDREACLAAGMDDYLSKPVSRKALERILESVQ